MTEGMLISSNVPESDHAIWNNAVTYTSGQRVIMTTGIHKVFEALTTNLNRAPDLYPLDWVEVSPTNRWKMFDSSGGTITTVPAGNIQFNFTADRVTSMGFMDIVANSIRVKASTTLDGVFFDQTYQIPDRAVINDWYDYFTQDPFRARELIIFDIPAVSGVTFEITIENQGNTIEVGNFVFGSAVQLGLTQYGATAGIVDYSIKNVDDFGRATVVERPYARRIDVKLYTHNQVVDGVVQRLNQLRATPCLWVGAKDAFETMSVYGFYRDYSVEIAYPTYSVCSLQIEGLT
jgi:hypothetical protein